jgi:hypothetical protein
MGLLALIFGQGTNLELSLTKIGPLLILIGFVATTLSICDPVGELQQLIIKSHRLLRQPREIVISREDRASKEIYNFLRTTIFGRDIPFHFFIPYIFAIIYSPEDMKRRFPQDYGGSSYISSMFPGLKNKYEGVSRDWGQITQWYEGIKKGGHVIGTVAASFYNIPLKEISNLLEDFKQETVKTKWITAEIDKITALIYFIVTISVFIVAIVTLPNLIHKFAQVFEDNESIRKGLLAFSIIALAAVGYMLVRRILQLLDKASTVFMYLTALTAIKMDKEKFRPNLQDVESYLNSNDWPLAKYWINRIQKDYTEVFLSKVSYISPVKESNTGGIPSYIR